MNILLLGGNGLLGHNVLRQLLFQGHNVKLLLRRKTSLDSAAIAGHEGQVSMLEGSLLDDATLYSAAQGCDAIVNCAGTTDMSLLRYDDYLPVNRDLCQRLVKLMEPQNIPCLVHTSTANTIGYGTPSHPADELQPMQPPFSRSYYGLSKREGEDILLDTARQHPGWHLIVVNPGFMIGAFDTKPSSGALLLAGYRKPLMVAPSGGKSFVHVADAAAAIVNALTMGQHGSRYLLTGQNLTLKEFYRLQAQTCHYRQCLVTVPNALLAVAGWIGDLLRLCSIRTQLSTRNVRQLTVREYYNNNAARTQLNMPSTHITQAISDFFAWRSSPSR